MGSPPTRWAWIAAALAVVFAATLVRFTLNFATTYPPATDAGYYPMQTLYWFAHGRLMYADLPLLFALNVAFTKILTLLGRPLDVAALLASRVLDCVLEPWTAVSVMVAGYTWSNKRARGLPGAIAAALFVVWSWPILFMLSDFQKNSLGFVWMAGAIWACRRVMASPEPRRWAALTLFLLLAAITHIGAFAVTTLIVVSALLIWYWPDRQHKILIFIGSCIVVFLGLIYFVDSRRALSIVRAPIDLFMSGPLWFTPLPEFLFEVIIIAFAVRRLRRDRTELIPADFAIVIALIGITAFLAVPKAEEYSGRLALMATVPLAFLIVFLTGRSAAANRSLIPAFFLLLAVPSITHPPQIWMQRPFMIEGAAQELREFRQRIADPQSTVVVAPHGLEWWSGYFLGTPVRMRKPSLPSSQYQRILLLRDTRDFPLPDMPGNIAPEPIKPPAQQIYKGRYIEIYEIPNS